MTENDKQEIFTAINDVKRLDRAKIGLEHAAQEYVDSIKICNRINLKSNIVFKGVEVFLIILVEQN